MKSEQRKNQMIGKRVMALFLSVSMLLQLIGTAFPVYSYASPVEEEESAPSDLEKTIRVTESEIRDAYESYAAASKSEADRASDSEASPAEADEASPSNAVWDDMIPFEDYRKEKAEEALKNAIGDAVIVKQENLGDNCTAIVAVNAKDGKSAKDVEIEDIFLVGMNGNDTACDFNLEIVNEGGLAIARALVTAYGNTLYDESDKSMVYFALDGEEEAETTEEDAEEVASPSEAEYEKASPSVATPATATASNADQYGEKGLFGTEYQIALDRDELNGLVENKTNVFRRMLRAIVPDEEEEDSKPAVMRAEAYGMTVVRTSSEDKTRAGNLMYFANMLDPELGDVEVNKGENNGEKAKTYDWVQAVFYCHDNPNDTTTNVMAFYSDGLFVTAVPSNTNEQVGTEEAVKQDEEKPYDSVYFVLHEQASGKDGIRTKDYRFFNLQGMTESDTGDFLLESVTKDCLFYHGQGDGEENANARNHWAPHPNTTPENLANRTIYIDARYLLGVDETTDDNLKMTIRLKNTKELHNVSNAEAKVHGVFAYHFTENSKAYENSVLVLEWTENGERKNFQFMYSLKSKNNMIHLSTLQTGENVFKHDGNIWGVYETTTTKEGREVRFDNTLTYFDKSDTLVAVAWKCDDTDHPHNPNEDIAPDGVVTSQKTDEDKFRAMLENPSSDLFIEKMTDSVEEVTPYPEWDQTPKYWSVTIPEDYKNVHIRFFRFASSEVNDGDWKELIQKKLDKFVNYPKGDYKGNTTIFDFTDILTVDNGHDIPTFYAAKGHSFTKKRTGNITDLGDYGTHPLHGKWDSEKAVNTLADESVNVPKGSFQQEAGVYYATAQMYDYYTDYEMTGHNTGFRIYDKEGKNLIGNPYYGFLKNYYDVLSGKVTNQVDTTGGEWGPVSKTLTNQTLTFGKLVSNLFEAAKYDREPLYLRADTSQMGNAMRTANFQYWKLEGSKRNNYDSSGNPVHGIMTSTLQKDSRLYMASSDGSAAEESPYFNEDFLRGNNSEKIALAKVYNNVSFPFRYVNGYWNFDSAHPKYSVRMAQDENSGTYYLKNNSEEEAFKRDDGTNPTYQFMPFSNGALDGKSYSGYGFAGNTAADTSNATPDFYFGMRLDIPFTLPKDRMVSVPVIGEDGKPVLEKDKDGNLKLKTTDEQVKFQFSGDDDVWIYVDGRLALDLGGIHDFGFCEINFAEKTLTYRSHIKDVKKVQLGSQDNPGEIDWNKLDDKEWTYVTRYKWTGEGETGYKKITTQNTSANWTNEEKRALKNDLWESLENDDGKKHTITIFYMERGHVASNLKMQFNFNMENTFEVKSELEPSNVTSDSYISQANKNLMKYLGRFDFSIKNAATNGEPLEAKLGAGNDLTLGKVTPFNTFKDLGSGATYIEPYGDGEGDVKKTDVWLARLSDDRTEAVIRSWDTTTGTSQAEIERRLVNIYPTTGKGNIISWPKDEPDHQYSESGDYLSLEVYTTGTKNSDNGSALYVGLLDASGNRIGGWANEKNLIYNDYANRLDAGEWSTIRISQKGLKQKQADLNQKFDWDNIKAVQVCYYDTTEIRVKDININKAMDPTQPVKSYKVEDKDISDYDSIQGGGTTKLSPAAGAWYNTTTTPTKVDENGMFSLGNKGSALFTDKFRTGSYLSVQMEELNKRIYNTIWYLTEDGETLTPSWLVSNTHQGDVVLGTKKTPDTLENNGREPFDARRMKNSSEGGTAYTLVKPDDEKHTILYRSFRQPNNLQTGFHIGVNFVTTVDIASIIVKKMVTKNAQGQLPDKDTEYYFVIVYDDVAHSALELNRENPFIADGFALKANEIKKINVVAGTHYRIYEVDRSLEEIVEAEEKKGGKILTTDGTKELTSLDQLEPYLSKTLVSVQKGKAEWNSDNKIYDIKTTLTTNHDEVGVYGSTGWKMTDGHAHGVGYTKDADGNVGGETGIAGGGVQGFIFTNGEEPPIGQYKAILFKKDEDGKTPLAEAKFELYYSLQGKNNYQLRVAKTTDKDGKIEVEKLPAGDYYFKETQAPVGYQLDPTKYYFTLPGAAGELEVSKTVTNKKRTFPQGQIVVIKYDDENVPKDPEIKDLEMKDPNAGEPTEAQKKKEQAILEAKKLAGAEFNLYQWKDWDKDTHWDEETGWVGGWNKVRAAFKAESKRAKENLEKALKEAKKNLSEPTLDENLWKKNSNDWTTNADGTVTIPGRDYGIYVLVETKAPDGYELPTDEDRFHLIELCDEETGVEQKLPVGNTSKGEARFRVQKTVTGLPGSDYQEDPFIIQIRGTDVAKQSEEKTDETGESQAKTNVTSEFASDVVLKHNEISEDVVFALQSTEEAVVQISEIIPMEYELVKIDLEADSKPDKDAKFDTETGILTLQKGANVTVVVQNKEKHTNYFHDTAAVTNTTSYNKDTSSWTFTEKWTNQKKESEPSTKLQNFLVPDRDKKRNGQEQTDGDGE